VVYRDRLAGAVIIDPSNPFVRHDDGVMTIKHIGGKTSGMVTADLFLDALVATSQPDVVAKMRAFSDAGCSAVRIAPLTAGSAPSDVQTAIAVLADALPELEQSPVRQL
jgi:hypothetical protein